MHLKSPMTRRLREVQLHVLRLRLMRLLRCWLRVVRLRVVKLVWLRRRLRGVKLVWLLHRRQFMVRLRVVHCW